MKLNSSINRNPISSPSHAAPRLQANLSLPVDSTSIDSLTTEVLGCNLRNLRLESEAPAKARQVDTTQTLPNKGLVARLGAATLAGLHSSLAVLGASMVVTLAVCVYSAPAGASLAESFQTFRNLVIPVLSYSSGSAAFVGALIAESKFRLSAPPPTQTEPEWHIAHPKV